MRLPIAKVILLLDIINNNRNFWISYFLQCRIQSLLLLYIRVQKIRSNNLNRSNSTVKTKISHFFLINIQVISINLPFLMFFRSSRLLLIQSRNKIQNINNFLLSIACHLYILHKLVLQLQVAHSDIIFMIIPIFMLSLILISYWLLNNMLK